MNRSSTACLLMTCLAWIPPCEAAVVAPEQLIDAARSGLQARTTGMPGEWEFLPVGSVPASHVEDGAKVRLEVGELEGQWPRRRVGVPVRIWVDDRLAQSRVLWFSVHGWRDALVYGRDARAGEPAEYLPTQRQRTDVAGYGEGNIVEGEAVLTSGLRLKRSVRAGQPVMAGDFAPVPAVERQERVTLSVRRGGVVLNTQAVAQEDAALGERVRVLPAGAGQWIEARVKGRGEVAIED